MSEPLGRIHRVTTETELMHEANRGGGNYVVTTWTEEVQVYSVESPDRRWQTRMLRRFDLEHTEQSDQIAIRCVQEMVQALEHGAQGDRVPFLYRFGGVSCPYCGGDPVVVEHGPEGRRRCAEGHTWRVFFGVQQPELEWREKPPPAPETRTPMGQPEPDQDAQDGAP